MLFFDPLEQFSIEIYVNLIGICNKIPATTITIMLLFNFIIVLLSINCFKQCFLLNKYQQLVAVLFNIVSNVLKDSIVIKKYFCVILLYVVFLFMLGLIDMLSVFK